MKITSLISSDPFFNTYRLSLFGLARDINKVMMQPAFDSFTFFKMISIPERSRMVNLLLMETDRRYKNLFFWEINTTV